MQGCQIAYNSFVLYHNFRHIVDVLQAVFSFLIAIGALPKYPYTDGKKADVSTIFGEPVQREHVTVIPVARSPEARTSP